MLQFKNWFFVEAMISELPDNVYIGIHNYNPNSTMIYFSDMQAAELKQNEPVWGFIGIQKSNECKYWVVELVNAQKGYGPLLYELAMEYASMPKNGGYGLAADRFHISPSAINVWKQFYNRSDVKKIPITDEYCADLSFKHSPEDTKIINYSYVKQPTTRLTSLKNKIVRRFMKTPLQAALASSQSI